jgi:hypothetical protein
VFGVAGEVLGWAGQRRAQEALAGFSSYGGAALARAVKPTPLDCPRLPVGAVRASPRAVPGPDPGGPRPSQRRFEAPEPTGWHLGAAGVATVRVPPGEGPAKVLARPGAVAR